MRNRNSVRRVVESALFAACTTVCGAAVAGASGCTGNITPTAAVADGSADGGTGAGDSGATADAGAEVTVVDATGAPGLASLAVSPLTLTPAFSPSVHDYTVRCSAGANVLTLDFAAQDGVRVAMGGGPDAVSTGATPTSVTVTLAEDAAAVISTSTTSADGDVTESQYWIRCLPHDFPPLTVSLHPGAGTPTPGYYLFGNAIVAASSGGFAMILDTQGTPVWYKRSPYGAVNVAPVAKNVVSYAPQAVGWYALGEAGRYQVLDLANGIASSVGAVGARMDHHELRRLPNGNWLTLSYPVTSGVDLTALKGFETQTSVFDCQAQEVDANGAVVWQWRASEHIDPATESTFPVLTTVNTDSAVDAYHCNSMEVASNGDILMSARHLDAVFLVSRATSKVVWKLGGSAVNKDGAQILTTVGTPFYRQHDARFLANGHISLFDDHTLVEGHARGLELALDLTAGTATPVFEYALPVSSNAMGSFRRYDDGESVVGWGMPASGPNTALCEVNAAGQVVFDVALGASDYAYRAVKVDPSMFDVDVLRASAGAP